MEVKLIMFKNDGQRKDFPVTGPTVSIGRGEDCGLRVPLLSVSRRHCELTVTDQEIKVRDLGSSNGTYLNNDRISEEIVLKAGDRLAVGPVVFTVQIDGEPEEIQLVKTKGQRMAEEQDREEEGVPVDVDVAPTVSTESGEAVVAVPLESEQVQEKVEEKAEEQAEELEQEESAVETMADASEEEEIDAISALEALADKRAKMEQGKPPSE